MLNTLWERTESMVRGAWRWTDRTLQEGSCWGTASCSLWESASVWNRACFVPCYVFRASACPKPLIWIQKSRKAQLLSVVSETTSCAGLIPKQAMQALHTIHGWLSCTLLLAQHHHSSCQISPLCQSWSYVKVLSPVGDETPHSLSLNIQWNGEKASKTFLLR